ncbi:hypothetical protein [Paractinoplanes durhamensis]|uniref:Uncharacterized protein n=1 Tax=Paractinoplanes durhamensis TaxID=113563 RepID=A0ABQ3YTX7_9ACTN|nr:hypothetical protein [Actinoplanes durhamensis]GIE01013.1 hypothetical protein Adu01nite_23630 [Actinoplanes durhamensis]
MDDALAAYGTGHADGMAGNHDGDRAGDPQTGADYLVGIVDGQIAAFEDALVAAIRKAMDEKAGDGPGV